MTYTIVELMDGTTKVCYSFSQFNTIMVTSTVMSIKTYNNNNVLIDTLIRVNDNGFRIVD